MKVKQLSDVYGHYGDYIHTFDFDSVSVLARQ